MWHRLFRLPFSVSATYFGYGATSGAAHAACDQDNAAGDRGWSGGVVGVWPAGVGPTGRLCWAAGGALSALEGHGPQPACIFVDSALPAHAVGCSVRVSCSANSELYEGMRVVCVWVRHFFTIGPPIWEPEPGSAPSCMFYIASACPSGCALHTRQVHTAHFTCSFSHHKDMLCIVGAGDQVSDLESDPAVEAAHLPSRAPLKRVSRLFALSSRCS